MTSERSILMHPRYPLKNSTNKIREGKYFIKTFPESIETEVEKGLKLYEISLNSHTRF